MRTYIPVALSLFYAGNSFAAKAMSKPNIIVIYSDDHGWADLGAQGVNSDIRTPNLDKMAADGVRFTHGYTTAPQSVPSRAGLITGRCQSRFDMEDNSCGRALPLEELTIPERLKEAGYVSCQVGKWHLDDPDSERKAMLAGKVYVAPYSSLPKDHGFDEYYNGQMNSYVGTHDLQGNKFANGEQKVNDPRFRCVWQADAASQFVKRHTKDPFFLYLAFFAPHVPLESPEPWFSQTPANLPLERRQALAMIAAMDEGIGKLRKTLRAEGLDNNTLIFFIGDNGAPLRKGAWDGSINLPLIGEKGMLTDAGMRTPFLAVWPETLPAGKVENRVVSSLDVAATAVSLAGLKKQKNLDGVNLIPFLINKNKKKIHQALYWRWRSQAAVLEYPYKLILLGQNEKYLFDITTPEGELTNLLIEKPKIAAKLEKKLIDWNKKLPPPGLPRMQNKDDNLFFKSHLNK